MNILVVDDDEDTTSLLAMMLARQGWRVDAAASVAEAQAALHANEYAVVITDLNLPDAPGVELLAGLADTGVQMAIVVSGAHDDAHRARESVSGVHYFSKPVDGRRLIRTIEGLVRKEGRS